MYILLNNKMNEPEDPGGTPKRSKILRKRGSKECGPEAGGGEDVFIPFFKPGYLRLYPEHCTNTDFKVFVESQDQQVKLGNKSPVYLNHIFTSEVKGVVALHRVNANKIAVVFKQYNTANNFITNTDFLTKHNLKAHIPAAQIEKTGIIRYVPTNISNKDLYTKLSSIYEIISVRRFTKKVGQSTVGLETVSITFLSNVLPDNIQYDLFSFRVFEYVPPLQQCFRCFKFNHPAKICNGKQRCSICAGEHNFRDCDKKENLCCVNCSGPHLAISKSCPIKMKKILEKKGNITYASVANTITTSDFPSLPTQSSSIVKTLPSINQSVHKLNKNVKIVNNVNKTVPEPNLNQTQLKAQIANNKNILMAMVQTLVELGNKTDNEPVTTLFIKDLLLKNLSH